MGNSQFYGKQFMTYLKENNLQAMEAYLKTYKKDSENRQIMDP